MGRAGAVAHGRTMRSRGSCRGKIPPRCVPGRSTMAKRSRNAFPGVRRWQDCALMRPWPDWQWQYSRAMRSRVPCRGKIPPRCVPGRQSVASFALHASRKRPRAGKSPVRGSISPPCIQNELALARYARHASEMPRKPPSEDTPREDPARKGHFSLHGSLESCTARRSCHPASTKRPSARNPCAADQRQTALAPAIPAPPSWQRATHSIRGASGSHTANAPTPHRPATLRRQADVKSCAARAPQRQSATRGPTAPQRPMEPSGRSIHNGGGATRLDANPDATGATAPTLPAASGAHSAKPPARPTRESAAAFGGTSLRSIESAHPPYIFIRRSCGGVFQLMLQEQLRFPATQANVEARRALAMAYRTETACHQHLVNAESTAILEHNNARLKAAIPPEPRQHVHRFAVHAPRFAIFRPVVHVCILEQVFV